MSEEEWRPIPGFSRYSVSSLGRVVSYMKTEPRILSTSIGSKGYKQLHLTADDGRALTRRAHQLVAAAFHGPCPEGQEVRHLDGNKLRNVPSNLAYGTSLENADDARRHGTNALARRTHCNAGHPFHDKNTRIPSNGSGRVCRTCCNARRYARRRRQAARLREQAAA